MRAIIFVHPGYLRRTDLFDPEEELKEHREDLEYGSYEEYLANMQRLRSVTNGNSIFMGELLDGKAHPYHREFGPSENELFIEWAAQREDSFVLQTYDGGKWKGVRKIKPEELAGFLGESDASSALLAGEMGPYCQSSDGCVGRIHSFLSDSMEVKGVKGCVFPLVPYDWWIGHEEERLAALKDIGVPTEHAEKEIESSRRFHRDLYLEAVGVI